MGLSYSTVPFAKIQILITTAFTLLLVLGVIFFKAGEREVIDSRLATPTPLVEEILETKASAFITPEFLPFVSPALKSFLPPISDLEPAARDKSAFWSLNRKRHFTVLLIGTHPSWQPLLNSLLESPLWVLSDVSTWGYLFRPKSAGVSEWSSPSEKQLQTRFPKPIDRARFLILTAANLATINHVDQAESLLGMAAVTHLLPSLLQSTQASLAASRGEWEKAVTLSKESLRSDHSNFAASKILIRGLIETGHVDEALNQARELVEENPNDEESLFLLARAASSANSGEEEISGLTQLVKAARLHRQPLGASLAYLGQAYAKHGNRGEALRSFQEAALAPEIIGDQRKTIHEIMDHLMEGNVSSSTLPSLKKPLNTNP